MQKIDFWGYSPPHLSYSTIDGYRTCGTRFLLQKILLAEQKPGLAALGGNAVHTSTEWHDMGKREGRTDEQLFKDAWDEEVAVREAQSPNFKVADYVATGRASKEYGGKRNIDWWMDNGPGMLTKWVDWRAEDDGWHIWTTPGGIYAVELDLLPEFDEGLAMKMFIDRMMVTPTGELAVLDIKTGRTPETAEQLGLYATGIEITYGSDLRPKWGYFWTPDKGLIGPYDLDMYTRDWFIGLANSAASGINAGCFMAKPANNCKAWCGVAQFCPAVGGDMTPLVES